MRKSGRIVVFLLGIAFVLGGCHLFEDYDELDGVAVYFNESTVTAWVGGLASLSLRVEPGDILLDYNVDYTISDESIAMVTEANNRGVVCMGRKKGSTVISAKIGSAVARAVINVVSD